jgi:hypothetical protein
VFGTLDRASVRSEMPLQRVSKCLRSRIVRQRAEDTQHHPAARDEDATHLPQGPGAIRKELEPELAQDCVERGIREGHVQDAGLGPANGCTRETRQGTGNREHRGVEIKPNDHTLGTDLFGSQARHDPGATGDVKHALIGLERSAADQIGCPDAGDRRDEIALIELGRVARQLPWFVVVYHRLRLTT